ncbi:MAG: penicillin-binding protein activator, partial [Deltaproteobacteria bacterium]|nr:penicillin-binding protein activator [Deltaproteobacteria bacterium]
SDLTIQAGQAYDRGDYATAANLYRRYLSQNPQSPRRETILALAGLSSELSGQFIQAIDLYQSLAGEFPNGAYTPRVNPRIVELYLLANRPDEALSRANALIPNETDLASQAALRLSAARALFTLKRYLPALTVYISAMSGATTSTRDQANQGVLACLWHLDDEELSNIFRQYGQNYPGPEAYFHLTRLAALKGDSPLFNERSTFFQRYFPTHPWLAALGALQTNPSTAGAQVPGLNYDPKPLASSVAIAQRPQLAGGAPGTFSESTGYGSIKVGALLPLSVDQNSRFAADILAGLKLALVNLAHKVTIVTFDTTGDPALTVKLVYEAANDPSMVVLVGPLNSPEALAAAQTAQTASLPMIATSQRLGLNQGRPMVFRVFLTPKHQAEAVARYAVKVKGMTRLGVLYPNDSYGQAMMGFYRSELERLGGQLTASVYYDPATRDWNQAIASLTGGKSVRRAMASYQAPVDFEALYIPDTPGNLNQILPQMAFHDVTRMVYLGTPLWLTSELPKNSGRYLASSLIPTAFNILSTRQESVYFRDRYQQTTGREPNQFAAYGYDAGLAVATAINAGASSRAQMVTALSTMGPFSGATGPFSFDYEGEYQVEPLILSIEGDEYVVVAEPASSR